MTVGANELVIRAALRNELSGPLKDILDELKKATHQQELLNQQAQRTNQLLGRQTPALAKATRSVNDYGLGFKRTRAFIGAATSELVRFAKVGLLGVAGVSVVTAKKIYDVGKSYQDSLNTFQSVTRATGKQMAAAAAEARLLGQDMTLPATSAADAAAAMTELAKGGLSVSASMKAAKGTLQLAAAAQIDASKAATIQVNTLNQFGLAAGKASHVADLLANTANASSGEITDMASALNYFGPVARDFGISVDSASTAIGVLGNAGIIGSQAGTSLRSALVNLAKPTDKMKDGMKALNLQLFDQKGHFLGLRAMTDQLWQAQKKLNPHEFNAALAKTFGKENLAAIAALASAGPQAYDKMSHAVGRVGGAADVAAAKTKGLGGAVQGLQSQLETVAIDVYTKAQPTLDKWVRGFAARIPAIEKSVGGFLKRTAGQGSALFSAAKTGNSKWAGHVLAQATGAGTGAEWTSGLKEAGSVVTDVASIFTNILLPPVKTVISYWKLMLVPLVVLRGLLGFVAHNTTLVRNTLIVLLGAYALYRTAITGLIVLDKARAAIAWINVVRQKQAVGATLAQRAAIIAVRWATNVWTAAQAALNVVMSMNPIALVVIAIAALTGVIIYGYKHWRWMRVAVDATWHALKWAWHWLQRAWDAAFKWVKNTGILQGAWSGIKSAIASARDVIMSVYHWFQKVIDIAGQVADKVGGAISKITNITSKAGGALGKLNPFGDTATPKAAGGNLSHTMGAAASIDRGVSGQRFVTSGYRTHSLGSGKSDHVMGRALDLIGTNLGGYANAVRKAGGYAQFHGSGGSRHLHVAMGGNVKEGRGSLPGLPGPYGDTAGPRAVSSTVASGGGGTVFLPGAVTVIIQGSGLDPDQLQQVAAAALSQAMQDQKERT